MRVEAAAAARKAATAKGGDVADPAEVGLSVETSVGGAGGAGGEGGPDEGPEEEGEDAEGGGAAEGGDGDGDGAKSSTSAVAS